MSSLLHNEEAATLLDDPVEQLTNESLAPEHSSTSQSSALDSTSEPSKSPTIPQDDLVAQSTSNSSFSPEGFSPPDSSTDVISDAPAVNFDDPVVVATNSTFLPEDLPALAPPNAPGPSIAPGDKDFFGSAATTSNVAAGPASSNFAIAATLVALTWKLLFSHSH